MPDRTSPTTATDAVRPATEADDTVYLPLVERTFTVSDQIALRDVAIREQFARTMMTLFGVTNVFVLIALGLVFAYDMVELRAGLITPSDRIVDARVVMALLGATTVQLGAVVYIMARAIFPVSRGNPQD